MIDLIHPELSNSINSLEKYRLTYEAGDDFIDKYLVTYSSREDTSDFNTRKAVTYVPAFAQAAINDIKNSIFQRIADVTRVEGPQSYRQAIEGLGYGVDLNGMAMNTFIGKLILPELLAMGKVGVFVDRQRITGQTTKADKIPSPYIYTYRIEDIMSWTYQDSDKPWEFKSVLLRAKKYKYDPETGLPDGTENEYRFFFLKEGRVHYRFYNQKDEQTAAGKLDISRIPFVLFQLTHSLLKVVADYQIALMNLSSSDMAFCLLSNFPFYTEQIDPRISNSHLKGQGDSDVVGTQDREITAGTIHGRTYAKNLNPPEFIAPPTGPLQASMEKQQQLKDEIRLLVNLNLSNVKPKMASAESKNMDERGLEAGLSYIGLELEHGERQIAQIWAMYESKESATVIYPKRYTLKTDEDILDETEKLEKRMHAIPSNTYKKQVAHRIADVMLGTCVSNEVLQTIHKEIDTADLLNTNPEYIFQAVENAIVSNNLAAAALGVTNPEKETEQASKDHAARVARIIAAQSNNSAARGDSDSDPNKNSGKDEKEMSQEPATNPKPGKAVRS